MPENIQTEPSKKSPEKVSPASRPGSPDAPYALYQKAREDLARLTIGPATPLRQVLREVTGIAAAALRVTRVTVWRLMIDGHVLLCEYLHQEGEHGVYEGTILHARDFPMYFKALDRKQVIPIRDVDGEQLTQEFREPYLRPLGIKSMLDAPIIAAGVTSGVVCHESIGEFRDWDDEECAFAAVVAETISRLKTDWLKYKVERSLGADPSRAREFDKMVTIGRLATGMAHDFKNVLAIITGYAEMIAKTAEDAQAAMPASLPVLAAQLQRLQNHTASVLAAAAQGEGLTRDLMELGQVESRKPVVLDLREFLTGCKALLTMGIRPGVTLSVEAGTPVSRVFIDRMLLERTLLNLVMNAGDAMPKGGRIRILLSESERPSEEGDTDRFVVLEVSDNGTGMTPEVRQRIFEPFFTTKGAKGTGLGMAIARQTISAAGGFLEIDTEPDRGTSIRIFLPRIGRPV
jgi:two-component system, cell cycle sensor histidine kinase and response regulator CckA